MVGGPRRIANHSCSEKKLRSKRNQHKTPKLMLILFGCILLSQILIYFIMIPVNSTARNIFIHEIWDVMNDWGPLDNKLRFPDAKQHFATLRVQKAQESDSNTLHRFFPYSRLKRIAGLLTSRALHQYLEFSFNS